MAYVIKEWFVSEVPNKDGVYIQIKGREGGIISFLLSLVGIDPSVSLVVDKSNIRSEKGSLSGFFRRVTPINNLCSGGYGYNKPWKTALMIGVVAILAGKISFILTWLFLTGASAYYFLHKEMTLELHDVGGIDVIKIDFKSSIIEGIKIDENEAARVINIIEGLVTHAASGGTSALPAAYSPSAQGNPPGSLVRAGLASTAPAAKEAHSPGLCPKCRAAINSEDIFCGGCGFKLR